MGRPRKTVPTDGELKVLHVMWALGPATIRDIREGLPAGERPSPPALATTMNAMIDKGIIHVINQRRPQTFAPIATRERTCSSILNDIRKRVFGGSVSDLVKHALTGRKQTPAEMAELRSLLDGFDDDAKKPKR